MPSLNEHKANYSHNKKLRDSDVFKNSREFLDWSVIILFYEAVHLVEQELAKHDYHLKSHQARNNCVKRTQPLNEIFNEYNTLYNQSVRARYNCCKFTEKDIKDLEAAFSKIETLVNPPVAS